MLDLTMSSQSIIPMNLMSMAAAFACPKNPDHSGFIPVRQFSSTHLPPSIRSDEVMEVFRVVADRTVRLRVGYADPKLQGSTHRRFRRSATGYTIKIIKSKRPCPCIDCQDAATGTRDDVWLIDVCTIRQFFVELEEARSTLVDFFYEEVESRNDGTMKTAFGVKILDVDDTTGVCLFQCVTHDRDLALGLQNLVNHDMFREPIPTTIEYCPFVLLVSHPHGGPKMVTCGEVMTPPEGHNSQSFFYNADTCPGCSGAHVLLVREISFRPFHYHGMFYHVGWDRTSGLSRCSHGPWSFVDALVNMIERHLQQQAPMIECRVNTNVLAEAAVYVYVRQMLRSTVEVAVNTLRYAGLAFQADLILLLLKLGGFSPG